MNVIEWNWINKIMESYIFEYISLMYIEHDNKNDKRNF